MLSIENTTPLTGEKYAHDAAGAVSDHWAANKDNLIVQFLENRDNYDSQLGLTIRYIGANAERTIRNRGERNDVTEFAEELIRHAQDYLKETTTARPIELDTEVFAMIVMAFQPDDAEMTIEEAQNIARLLLEEKKIAEFMEGTTIAPESLALSHPTLSINNIQPLGGGINELSYPEALRDPFEHFMIYSKPLGALFKPLPQLTNAQEPLHHIRSLAHHLFEHRNPEGYKEDDARHYRNHLIDYVKNVFSQDGKNHEALFYLQENPDLYRDLMVTVVLALQHTDHTIEIDEATTIALHLINENRIRDFVTGKYAIDINAIMRDSTDIEVDIEDSYPVELDFYPEQIPPRVFEGMLSEFQQNCGTNIIEPESIPSGPSDHPHNRKIVANLMELFSAQADYLDTRGTRPADDEAHQENYLRLLEAANNLEKSYALLTMMDPHADSVLSPGIMDRIRAATVLVTANIRDEFDKPTHDTAYGIIKMDRTAYRLSLDPDEEEPFIINWQSAIEQQLEQPLDTRSHIADANITALSINDIDAFADKSAYDAAMLAVRKSLFSWQHEFNVFKNQEGAQRSGQYNWVTELATTIERVMLSRNPQKSAKLQQNAQNLSALMLDFAERLPETDIPDNVSNGLAKAAIMAVASPELWELWAGNGPPDDLVASMLDEGEISRQFRLG